MVPVPNGPRLLWVVDDSPLDAEHARRILARHYRVEVIRDGAAAIERLAAGEAPDVLVLDWVMPDVTGLDVCRFLRSSSRFSQVRIVLLTVRHEVSQIVEGLSAGADDYLPKPWADEELLARVATQVQTKILLERAERAEGALRQLLAEAPDALLAVDAQSRLTFANQRAEQVLGLPMESLIGQAVGDAVPGLSIDSISVGPGEALFPLPDVTIGDRIFSPAVRVLATDSAGRTTIALRDVTDQRRAQARRLDFYSVIAHDLRSPLSAILLRTQHILRGGRGLVSAELTRDIRRMEASVRAMMGLINDFLDLARLEGTGYKIDQQPTDLLEVVENAVEDFRPLSESKNQALDLMKPPRAVTVLGDGPRLGQVVSNLLSNSVKYTHHGGEVQVSIEPDTTCVTVRVRDNGPGIPPERHSKLFRRYSRLVEEGGSSGGSGLGLMIVREIVEAHGGSVGLESAEGEGSTFWFRVPLAPQKECPSS